ncbi:recombinase family protein [Candidatus Dojkabacteria bacterium]|nr:recombinase family protein [Candidatus Dojkabacteria bacterium]
MKEKESQTKKRVAIYTRVSSEEQKREGLSLDAQRKALEDYAQLKGFWVYKIYTDAGISGFSIKKRKAFKEMLTDAKAGKFSAILITKFDRAFRNVVDAIKTVEELKTLKIDLVSLNEQVDTTTAMGNFFFILMSALAQLERDLTVERVSETNSSKFSNGIMIGRSPLGYMYSKKQKRFIPDPKTKDMIIDIFQMTAQGINYRYICGKHNLGFTTYYKLIRNEFYMGNIRFKKNTNIGNHEPLISKELFAKCQK